MFEHQTFAERSDTESRTTASRSTAFDELSLSALGAGLRRMFLAGGQILFREITLVPAPSELRISRHRVIEDEREQGNSRRRWAQGTGNPFR
jgi:hypothetical protein